MYKKDADFIISTSLSIETGYTTNAIRQKRNADWKNKVISKKDDSVAEVHIHSFNRWCASKSPIAIHDLSNTQVQFMKFSKFHLLHGLTLTQLSRFCDSIKINFNTLVVTAPDGNKLVNVVCYKRNLIDLLKYLSIL